MTEPDVIGGGLFLLGLYTGIHITTWVAERHRSKLNAEVRRLRAECRKHDVVVDFLTTELRRRLGSRGPD